MLSITAFCRKGTDHLDTGETGDSDQTQRERGRARKQTNHRAAVDACSLVAQGPVRAAFRFAIAEALQAQCPALILHSDWPVSSIILVRMFLETGVPSYLQTYSSLTGIWSEFYYNRNICWIICHADGCAVMGISGLDVNVAVTAMALLQSLRQELLGMTGIERGRTGKQQRPALTQPPPMGFEKDICGMALESLEERGLELREEREEQWKEGEWGDRLHPPIERSEHQKLHSLDGA
ncbi:hypothetical protein ZIOFF_072115 [Zingiber officinale]|uniref:Uncharacterized protein n=1 Tax=Zingiber officinale TaxID=94328 RepID=A0A8J5C2J0_ZINOF|nr:hypothetical protein ZIOFF_072115 [Zingiber officinale]